ncbi:MAG: hypothetical protein ABIJ97_05795 [Bacteroidota bacterium]
MIKSVIAISFIIFFIGCGNKLEQEVVSTYPSGVPMKIIYFKWVGDQKDIVKETRFYANGEKEIEGELKNGMRHGKWTYWYDTGIKWSEGYFKDDMSDGKFTIWYKSGLKNYDAEYKEGKPNGKWVFCDDSGKKFKEVIFNMGEKVSEKEY